MIKPHGRKIKKQVGQILENRHQQTAMAQLAQIPDKQLTGHLFSYFYHTDELIKFRASAAMGRLGARIGQTHMEKARIVLRRIMWNLNDESGGIGWGSPEAMGEILSQSPALAGEFKSILFSYLDPGGNFIEHEVLQRGVIWGIGTFLKHSPYDLDDHFETLLTHHLNSADPIKVGYAVRALIHASQFNIDRVPASLLKDTRIIPVFNGWDIIQARIMDLALNHAKE